VLLNAIEEIKEKGNIWRRTGGTHSSLICTKEGEIVSFCEDVSRACSADKAVGAALLSKNIGMTLVAFVRKPNLYVYSGEERIL